MGEHGKEKEKKKSKQKPLKSDEVFSQINWTAAHKYFKLSSSAIRHTKSYTRRPLGTASQASLHLVSAALHLLRLPLQYL